MLKNGDTRFENTTIDPESMNIILFTSGTTSASKAVMLSQKNIVSNVHALNTIVKIYDNDRNLAFLPFHHTFGSTGLLFFISNGVSNVFCDGLKYIQKNLQEYHVTVFVTVPLLLEAMNKKILKEIEKAILASDIGINPNNDGKVIRLAFPELNEERRKEIVKDVRKMAEEAKVAIRSIRREGIDTAKATQKNNEMTEDELKQAENEIQKMTDKSIEEIDKILETKEKEVMSV